MIERNNLTLIIVLALLTVGTGPVSAEGVFHWFDESAYQGFMDSDEVHYLTAGSSMSSDAICALHGLTSTTTQITFAAPDVYPASSYHDGWWSGWKNIGEKVTISAHTNGMWIVENTNCNGPDSGNYNYPGRWWVYNTTPPVPAPTCQIVVNQDRGTAPSKFTIDPAVTPTHEWLGVWVYNAITRENLYYETSYGDGEYNYTAMNGGTYSVEMQGENEGGTCSAQVNVTVGAVPTPAPTPSPYPTPGPNVTTFATLGTIATGIPTFINRSDYRGDIEDSPIGNITAGYLDTVDGLTDAVGDIAGALVSILVIPFAYITPAIASALGLAVDLITNFASLGHWVLLALGKIISGLPGEIQGLVTLGLIYQTLLLAIKGRAGVT